MAAKTTVSKTPPTDQLKEFADLFEQLPIEERRIVLAEIRRRLAGEPGRHTYEEFRETGKK
jgi:hypothetical protein